MSLYLKIFGALVVAFVIWKVLVFLHSFGVKEPSTAAIHWTPPLPVATAPPPSPTAYCIIPETVHEYKLTRERLTPDVYHCVCSFGFAPHALRVWVLGAPESQWTDVSWHEDTKTYDRLPNDVEYVAAIGQSFVGKYKCSDHNY